MPSHATAFDNHVDRLIDSRVRQGLPRHVDDPAIVAKVADLLRPAGIPERREAA